MKKFIFSLTLVGAVSSSVAQVAAQKPAESKASPSPTTITRERRSAASTTSGSITPASTVSAPASGVVQNTSTKTEQKTSDTSSGATKQGDQTDVAKPVEEKKEPGPTDPVSDLKAQIEGAETSQQRVPLQLKLVDLLAGSGKRTEAVAELNAIVASDEFNPQGYFNTGNSFARLGETDAAITAYRKALDQRKGQYSKAYNNLGVLLLRIGRWDEAYDAFISALKLESFHYAEASYNLGRLYAARGENDLAIREWKRTLTIDKNHEAAANALAHIGTEGSVVVAPERAKADNSTKRKSSEQAGNSLTPARTNPIVTTPATTIKNTTAGSNRKVFTLDSASYQFLQRARESSEHGKTQEAIADYQRVIARQGGYFAPANLEMSYLLVATKRFDEAQANLLKVSNRDGNLYPASYFHLARLYELRNELPLAEAAFSRAAEAYGPRNSQVLLDLSRVREKQGNFKGALQAMEQYLNIMDSQGQHVSWSDERLSELRRKSTTTTPR